MPTQSSLAFGWPAGKADAPLPRRTPTRLWLSETKSRPSRSGASSGPAAGSPWPGGIERECTSPKLLRTVTDPSETTTPVLDGKLVTETAGFANTVGFNDDARSLLTIPARHDMARRVDAGFLAELLAEHRLTQEEAFELAEDLAVGLARRTFVPRS